MSGTANWGTLTGNQRRRLAEADCRAVYVPDSRPREGANAPVEAGRDEEREAVAVGDPDPFDPVGLRVDPAEQVERAKQAARSVLTEEIVAALRAARADALEKAAVLLDAADQPIAALAVRWAKDELA